MGRLHRMGDAPLVPLGAAPVRAPWQADRMGLTRAWGTRTDVDRADLATRTQLFAIAASEPLVVLLVVADSTRRLDASMVLLLCLSVIHAGVCLGLLRQSLNRLRRGSGFSSLLVLAVAVVGAAGVAASVIAFPGPGHGRLSLEAGASMLTFGAAVVGTYTPLLPVRVLPALVVVPTVGLLVV